MWLYLGALTGLILDMTKVTDPDPGAPEQNIFEKVKILEAECTSAWFDNQKKMVIVALYT